jgi:hypothetical protein
MRVRFYILAFILSTSSLFGQAVKKPVIKPGVQAAKKAVKKGAGSFMVSGQVNQIYPRCGGARLSPKQSEEAATPQPYSGKKFYVRKGNTNTTTAPIAASFTSDENGKFSLRLPAGTYSIIVEEQLNTIQAEDYRKDDISVDETCLKEWWSKPYQLITVKKNIVNLNFTFRKRCFIPSDVPCLKYTGPMPP